MKKLPGWCADNYGAKVNLEMKSLARSSNDTHAWNAATLYDRTRFLNGKVTNNEHAMAENLNYCDTSLGGKVKIALERSNKYHSDFLRPLPNTIIWMVSLAQYQTMN